MMSESLTKALNEKDVEHEYRHAFKNIFKDMEITSPYGGDGFGISKSAKLRVLFEFKDDLRLSNKIELCKVLSQSIYYLKKADNAGDKLPSTIFIGDRDECVVLHVNDVIDYLDMVLDWSIAPSSAYRNNELMMKLIKDENIKPFVFNAKDFTQCVEKLKDLTDNVQRKVLVNDKNIVNVFQYFDKNVLGKTNLTTNDKANLFIQILVNPSENYLVGSKKIKKVHTKSFGQVPIVSRENFESFFSHFSSSYSPSQKHKLAAVVDRIVEDTTRRKQGEFFTPAIWVDKAHEYIASVYGENWKEEYVVWDPAWGTGNLTRDYKFAELYVSTLNQSDIDTAKQMGYNSEAIKFQYDFLNDDYEKLPEGLRKAIEEGRPVIVLMNPPYAAGTGQKVSKENVRKGMSETLVGNKMINDGLGRAKQQLYVQFMYRCMELKLKSIAIFSKPLFMTGGSFHEFLSKLEESYEFKNGFLMNSSEFADVESWGLSFTIWGNEK